MPEYSGFSRLKLVRTGDMPPPPIAPSPYIELGVSSPFSFLRGSSDAIELVRTALTHGYDAIGIADRNTLAGIVRMHSACDAVGIKPLIGCDIWLENESNRDQPYRALLLCQSHDGYLRLCELLSRAYLHNQYRGRAEINRAWFAEAGGSEGLLMLSGAMQGDVGQALLQGNLPAAGHDALDSRGTTPSR